MSGPVYDAIGRDFNANRRADPRIAAMFAELLDLPAGALIAEIGAGTGNYSNALAGAGFEVRAVEPSAEMRAQAPAHDGVTWFEGTAENIPLPDRSVAGVVISLALHHFPDVAAAAREVARICHEGPLVVFTIDPRLGESFWFADYFPDIYRQSYKFFPPLDEICGQVTGAVGAPWKVEVVDFPLPADLIDFNMNAGWSRPEIYLDPVMRQNTSGFALGDPGEVAAGIARLEADLESGAWERRYGALRQRPAYDLGFRFLRFRRAKG